MPILTENHYRKLTDEESWERYEKYGERLVATAKGICLHFDEQAVDKEGRHLCPCQQCIRTVRHVVELWAEYLKQEAVSAAEKMHEKRSLHAVQLHHAYELGMAVLWPEYGKAVDGWGPL